MPQKRAEKSKTSEGQKELSSQCGKGKAQLLISGQKHYIAKITSISLKVNSSENYYTQLCFRPQYR